MGPDLENKEKLRAGMEMRVVKANGNVLGSMEDAFMHCNFNYEQQYFNVEALPCQQANGVDQHEDVEVNVDDCLTTFDKVQGEILHEDATDSVSSFGNTDAGSGIESGLGNAEVESQLYSVPGPASILDECRRPFGMRKKRPTDHWRRFIRPIMWRCKWIELKLKEFQNQAQKYDRELAENEQQKACDLGTFLVEDFHVKSLPFSSCTEQQKAMKRKKRRRLEETTNVASYMAQHNLFSYYDYKNNPAGGVSVDHGRNQVADSKINGSHGLGPDDGWAHLESKDNDNMEEQLFRKIEVLQMQVCKLRSRIDIVVSQIPKEFSGNMLSLSAPSDALNSSDPDYASPPQNGDMIPSASSHGEITPISNIIKITGLPHTGGSWGNGEEQIPINNQGAKEEIPDIRNFGCHLKEEHQPMMEKRQALEVDMLSDTLVSRVRHGGKSLPKCSSMISITKRKRGKRRSTHG